MQNAAKRESDQKKRKGRVTTLIIRQKRIKQKNVTKAKEGPIHGSIYQENTIIINIYAPKRTSKYKKQKHKGEIDISSRLQFPTFNNE